MRNIIVIMMLLFLFSACRMDSNSGRDVPSQTDEVTVTKPAKQNSAAAVVLAEDYTSTFQVAVRSQRHELAGTKFRHVLITEYSGVDAEAVIATSQSDLGEQGFDVKAPLEHGDAVRITGKKKGLQIFADVYGDPAVDLQTENARGIVSFTWIDAKSQ